MSRTMSPRTTLARGVLPTAVKLGDANVPPPTGGGGPELLWWSEASFQYGNMADKVVGFATRYRKLWLAVHADQDITFTFARSVDGVLYGGSADLEDTYAYVANTTAPFAYEPKSPWLKVFQTAAVTPTVYAFALEGDESESPRT